MSRFVQPEEQGLPVRRLRTAAGLLLAALLGVATAGTAAAQPEQQAAPSATPYVAKVQTGIRLAVARGFEGALAALREAMVESPGEPAARYHIAAVERMRGNLAEALESFRSTANLARDAGDVRLQAKALQGVAETLERQEDQLNNARQAWIEYAQWADAHRDVANPEVARARIQAIDVRMEQEEAYEAVRERIAEREAQAEEDE